MKPFVKSMLVALVCFLVVVLLNFVLPRLLPGDPIAYLSGFAEEDLTTAQVARYRESLHLDEPLLVQFGYYLRSLTDGTLGYSFKKNAVVAELIRDAAAQCAGRPIRVEMQEMDAREQINQRSIDELARFGNVTIK